MKKRMKQLLALALSVSMLSFHTLVWADTGIAAATDSVVEEIILNTEDESEVSTGSSETDVDTENSSDDSEESPSEADSLDTIEKEVNGDTTSGKIQNETDATTDDVNAPDSVASMSDSILPVSPASVASDFTYSVKNNVATITGYSGTSPFVYIPSSYRSYPVQYIADHALENNTVIATLILPATITSIGQAAFRNCPNLSSILIAQESSLTTIYLEAFENCSALPSVSIPGSVTTIGTSAFFHCSSLKTVEIEAGTKESTIGYYAFSECTSLETITIPNNYVKIGNESFSGDTALTSVTIGDSGNGSKALTIGERAFFHCTSLQTVSFHKTVSTIESEAFLESGLRTLTLPEGLETIEEDAFRNCLQLTSVSIPGSVTQIGSGAFLSCKALSSVTIKEGTASACLQEFAFGSCQSLTSITIPKQYVQIGQSAFNNCNKLKTVILEDSGKSSANQTIGYAAFKGCTSLQDVYLPNTLLSIGALAFMDVNSNPKIRFSGNAPWISPTFFHQGTATCYYPANNTTWTKVIKEAYEGTVTWLPWTPTAPPKPGAFSDVPSDSWYYNPVIWSVENGITNGTTATTFSPSNICTRAQVVTFLWRAAGQPKVSGITNPFKDVKSTDYYYNAVLWALSKGITGGTTATTFSPNANCTRAQVVTLMWRWAGQPSTNNTISFTDVKTSDYFYPAVKWAVNMKITNGTTSTTFSPNAYCTRAQVVTFLYNYLHR